jgi:hypothetical protein
MAACATAHGGLVRGVMIMHVRTLRSMPLAPQLRARARRGNVSARARTPVRWRTPLPLCLHLHLSVTHA